MYTPTTLEKILATLRNWVYRLVKPIYLWSIREESLEDYIRGILRHELLYSDKKLAISTLQEFIDMGKDSYFCREENKEEKEKIEKIIEVLKSMK